MDISGIDNLGIDRVIRRKTADIIVDTDKVLLVYDRVSGAYMLADKDTDSGLKTLDRYIGGCELLMTSNYKTGLIAYEKYGFTKDLRCYQVAYYGDIPEADTKLEIRTADENDLPLLIETYRLITADEMKKVVQRGSLLLGYADGELVGFIGEHLEGSMGLLYVFPEHRRKGCAETLEKYYIINTINKGFIPFGQVEKDNFASLKLQKKLGFVQSENLIFWMVK